MGKIDSRLHFRNGLICAQLNADSRFSFPADDHYWASFIKTSYEPELEWLLMRAADLPYAMLDCGANFGYWSILASSGAYGRHPVVAIEASRANFELLVHNCRDNDSRYQCIHAAIAENPGGTARLFGTHHYGRSLRVDWHPNSEAHFEDVDVLTLDQLAEQFLPDCSHPPLIKLDVEGVEIQAMRGGSGLLDRGALVFYEDHGKEPTHPVTDYVLSRGDMEIWYRHDERGLTRILRLDQVSAIKVDPRSGYNFFAVRPGSPWSVVLTGEIV
jgi:FkbM family methyltransferase